MIEDLYCNLLMIRKLNYHLLLQMISKAIKIGKNKFGYIGLHFPGMNQILYIGNFGFHSISWGKKDLNSVALSII